MPCDFVVKNGLEKRSTEARDKNLAKLHRSVVGKPNRVLQHNQGQSSRDAGEQRGVVPQPSEWLVDCEGRQDDSGRGIESVRIFTFEPREPFRWTGRQICDGSPGPLGRIRLPGEFP